MRHICLRIIFNMYINDGPISQRIKGHRMTFTYLEYGYNFEIFYTNIYSELSFKLYLSTQIYTHKNMFYHTSYYKYFSYDNAQILGGEE